MRQRLLSAIRMTAIGVAIGLAGSNACLLVSAAHADDDMEGPVTEPLAVFCIRTVGVQDGGVNPTTQPMTPLDPK